MIYVVTGFMRSGTSMMMGCLKAGGLPIVADDARDAWAREYNDTRYSNNPRGLYEPRQHDMREPGFPRQHDGYAVKLVIPYLQFMAVHEYRVVMLLRDPEEIRQSYYAAFRARLSPDFPTKYPRIVDEAVQTLHNRKDVVSLHTFQLREFWHQNTTPFRTLIEAGWPIDPLKAAQYEDTSLNRFRIESLVVGA